MYFAGIKTMKWQENKWHPKNDVNYRKTHSAET
jgi:hypothetical protein